MLKQLRNIDSAFRLMRLLCLLFVALCSLLCGFLVWDTHQARLGAQNRIYVLANGEALPARLGSREANLEVEARDQIRRFHEAFFNLDPDEQSIQRQLDQALYLADGSAAAQYENLRESHYYEGLMSANISQRLETDSIRLFMDRNPIGFRFYGKQRIIRSSSILWRSLITEGSLRVVARSDHNPHGLLIQNWRIVENQNLRSQARQP